MPDVFAVHSDAITDCLLAGDDVFDAVDDGFAAASERADGSSIVDEVESDRGRAPTGSPDHRSTAAPLVDKWPISAPLELLSGRRARRVATLVAAFAAVCIVVAVTVSSRPDRSDSSGVAAGALPSPPTPALPTAVADEVPPGDPPVVVQSAESRCTGGSTDPMHAFDADPDNAWVCIPGYGVPGTVLRVRFDGWYQVTSLSVVPGWDRINSDGSDEWPRHKTAAVIEYQFNDPDQTRLTQPTNSIRGSVLTPVTPPVLASAMTITITAFGVPADATDEAAIDNFAISSLAVLGRRW